MYISTYLVVDMFVIKIYKPLVDSVWYTEQVYMCRHMAVSMQLTFFACAALLLQHIGQLWAYVVAHVFSLSLPKWPHVLHAAESYAIPVGACFWRENAH